MMRRRLSSSARGGTLAGFGVLVIVIAAAVGLSTIGNRATSNCQSIHRLVSTLDSLIADGREQAIAYQHEGTITRAQLDRALKDNDRSRELLGEADCPPRYRATP